jgi:hypothetical protein
MRKKFFMSLALGLFIFGMVGFVEATSYNVTRLATLGGVRVLGENC